MPEQFSVHYFIIFFAVDFFFQEGIKLIDDTDERKQEFLQRYGWLMDDEAIRAYSARFKPMK